MHTQAPSSFLHTQLLPVRLTRFFSRCCTHALQMVSANKRASQAAQKEALLRSHTLMKHIHRRHQSMKILRCLLHQKHQTHLNSQREKMKNKKKTVLKTNKLTKQRRRKTRDRIPRAGAVCSAPLSPPRCQRSLPLALSSSPQRRSKRHWRRKSSSRRAQKSTSSGRHQCISSPAEALHPLRLLPLLLTVLLSLSMLSHPPLQQHPLLLSPAIQVQQR